MIVKGDCHIHSAYSHDGKHTLEQIADIFQSRGVQFVMLAEHAELGLTAERYNILVRECAALSSESFLMIPGLEIETSDGYHILAYGVQEYFFSNSLDEVIESAGKHGGISILAHPVWNNFTRDRRFKDLDGIEVMSSKFDGKWSPRWKSYLLYKKVQQYQPALTYTSGIDFHTIQDLLDPSFIYLELQHFDSDRILNAIKNRCHYIGNGSLKCQIHSSSLPVISLMLFCEYIYLPLRNKYRLMRGYIIEAHKLLIVKHEYRLAFKKLYRLICRLFRMSKNIEL